jgi:hypothetical protein
MGDSNGLTEVKPQLGTRFRSFASKSGHVHLELGRGIAKLEASPVLSWVAWFRSLYGPLKKRAPNRLTVSAETNAPAYRDVPSGVACVRCKGDPRRATRLLDLMDGGPQRANAV